MGFSQTVGFTYPFTLPTEAKLLLFCQGKTTLNFVYYGHISSKEIIISLRLSWVYAILKQSVDVTLRKNQARYALVLVLYSLETSTFEKLGSEFINFACNCVINTLRLIVYLTGFSI